MKKSSSKIAIIKQEFDKSKRDIARGNIAVIDYTEGNNVKLLNNSRFRKF